jgi:recombination protein RecT
MSDLVKRSGGSEIVDLIEKMKPGIAQALPKHISAERIARIALTAVRSNPMLAKCTPQSFLGSLLQASQLGLEVNTPLGQAYLIPYKDVCTLVVGYQGMLDLSRRSGMVKAIYAYPVFQGDTFNYELGLEPKLQHKPCEEPGDLTHVYAVARLTDGEPIFTVLTRKDVERYRNRSRAKDSGPWVTDFVAMALKTAIRRLFRWLPKSAEQALAVAIDEAGERNEPQLDSFAPEVVGLLSEIPSEPAPSPVPAGTPEGKRISLKGPKKQPTAGATAVESKGATAPAKVGSEAPPPQPAARAGAVVPADPPTEEEVIELHELLAQVDDQWSEKGLGATIEGWSEMQRASARIWANAVLNDGPMVTQANRPAHTIVGRQPGEEG